MEHAGIDAQAQYATSLPKELWDPVGMLPPWGYKEELLKNQQEIRRKIEEKKALGPREAIEFVSGSGRVGASLSGDSSLEGTTSSAKAKPSAAERVMAGLSRERTSSPMNTDRDRGKRTTDLERRPRRKRSRSR